MCEGGSVAEWLACWTQLQKGLGSNHAHRASDVPSSEIGSSPLKGCGGNCGPG